MIINVNKLEYNQNFGSKKLPYMGEMSASACYSRAVRRTNKLSEEAEKEVVALAQKGDKKAKDKLFESRMSLVATFAKSFVGFGVPFLDLVAEGHIGLIEALERYDSSRGRFATFAGWKIRGRILAALDEQARTIKQTRYAGMLRREYERVVHKLTACLENDLTEEQIAKEMEINVDKVRHLKNMGAYTFESLDAPLHAGDKRKVIDSVADESVESPIEEIDNSRLREFVAKCISTLPTKQQQQVVTLLFGFDGVDGRTLEDVGEIMGSSRQNIFQILGKAMGNIQRPSKLKKLREYAEA